MRSHNFSKDVFGILEGASWHPGRSKDISTDIALLEEEGFEVHDAAREFLEEFAGLSFSRRNGPIDFDWRSATKWIPRSHIPYLDGILNIPLCPVGRGGGQFFLISKSGDFIFLNDEWLFYDWFVTIEEAFQHIFLLETGPCIPIELPNEMIPPGYRE